MPSPQSFAGTQLAISWLNALLFMLELVLAIYYFSWFPTKRLLRHLLKGVLLADSICMIAMFAATWEVLLGTFKEDPTKNWTWSIPLASFMVMIIAIFEELFLIDRCRRLGQTKYITIPLVALVIAHAVLNLYSIVYVMKNPQIDPYKKRYGTTAAGFIFFMHITVDSPSECIVLQLTTVNRVTACLAATVDTLIPLALSWQLYKVTPTQISRQRSWLDTMINMVSSGGLGGVMSLVQVIIFWIRADVFYVLLNTMGRIYGITIFVNLLEKTMSGGISLISVSVSVKAPSPSASAKEKQLPPTPRVEEHPDLDTQSEAPLHSQTSLV
ncbi:hypothetical protein CVT24_013228 [Panaeolus cyanescens]|uniref:Uncharacterized protein n=1 Tax=Panaeolus cyanescens TaxID=181874 RepID=A0A409WAL0_9AGAR|nr:hypothetical protein CVT24_013228 [Panaeolus cyanescens]